MIVRDMTSKRLGKCGHTWPCPPKEPMTTNKVLRDEEASSSAQIYTYPNWPKKTEHSRAERYLTYMQYEIGYIVLEACEDGFKKGWDRHAELLREDLRKVQAAFSFCLQAAEYVYAPDKLLTAGLCPTFYHTLTYEGDLTLIMQTKQAREAKAILDKILEVDK